MRARPGPFGITTGSTAWENNSTTRRPSYIHTSLVSVRTQRVPLPHRAAARERLKGHTPRRARRRRTTAANHTCGKARGIVPSCTNYYGVAYGLRTEENRRYFRIAPSGAAVCRIVVAVWRPWDVRTARYGDTHTARPPDPTHDEAGKITTVYSL